MSLKINYTEGILAFDLTINADGPSDPDAKKVVCAWLDSVDKIKEDFFNTLEETEYCPCGEEKSEGNCPLEDENETV